MQNLVETAYINQVTTVPVHELGELPISRKSTQPRHMDTLVTIYVDIQGLLAMLNRRHFLLLILGVPPHTIDTVGPDLFSTSFQINPHILPTKDLMRSIWSTRSQQITHWGNVGLGNMWSLSVWYIDRMWGGRWFYPHKLPTFSLSHKSSIAPDWMKTYFP